MLVMWMDHRKCQGLIVTFDDTKNKAIYCYSYLKRETGPIPKFSANTGWFYKFKTCYGFHNVSVQERLRAPTTMPLLPTQIISGPSSRRRGTSPSRSSAWMKQACSGRRCPMCCRTCIVTSSLSFCRLAPSLCCSRWIKVSSGCSRHITFRRHGLPLV